MVVLEGLDDAPLGAQLTDKRGVVVVCLDSIGPRAVADGHHQTL